VLVIKVGIPYYTPVPKALAPEPKRPECQRHDKVFVDSAGTWVEVSEIGTAGPNTLVPEYHDCQRLLVKGASPKKFGPLVAVFAAYTLGQLGDPVGFIKLSPALSATPGTVLPRSLMTVAPLLPVVTVPPLPVTTVPPFPAVPVVLNVLHTGEESAVATILNYDEEYGPLHILSGYSCLYVYHTGSSPIWKAHLVFAGSAVRSDTLCTHPLDLTIKPSWDLNVEPTPDPYPVPVARWDWDTTAGEHYIGLQCGTSWCEVYSELLTAHASSPTYQGWGKGWYDEQYLAEKATHGGQPDDLEPGLPVGSIFPIGNLAANTISDFSKWKEVAEVSISEESAPYKNKFNFVKSTAPYGKAFVSLCKGTTSDCSIPWIEVLKMNLKNKCANTAELWWAKLESTGGDPTYRCVIRHPPPVPGAALPPGVVRWRWMLKDEGMWVRCPGGCCQVT
jgi:hypothetical protein